MSEPDAIQAIYAVREVAASDSMNFIALVSAYLAVTYFVGTKSPNFQTWAITGLYSVWVIAPIMVAYITTSDINSLDDPDFHPMLRYPKCYRL